MLQRGGQPSPVIAFTAPELDADDVEDLDDAPEQEVEDAEARILDQATAARSIVELKAELDTLKALESLALGVRRRSADTKWRELASLLGEIFSATGRDDRTGEPAIRDGDGAIPRPAASPHQKLVVFTEHRDTLRYLQERITTLLGRQTSVVVIHGSVGREERLAAQEAFRHDPQVQVLLATDAAGEGINLQRAHLMVNYDLPWNPNRLEQRFGRIHRIGQTEVCHLWNLVADETREGDVYRRLLDKLEQARQALGGQVFDVLGKLEFEGRPLRELLLDAIRYGEQPEVRARLDTAVDQALDRVTLQDLLEERQLLHDAMDASRVQRVREEMERADARRLQPHYIESFFREAFRQLGGSASQRETRRYQVSHVPALIRNRDRVIGTSEPVLPRYERIVFEKPLVAPPRQPLAAFVCPGHPLLDAVIDLILERHRDLLKRGAVLVDERDHGTTPRVLFSIEHALQDAGVTRAGDRRVVSKRVLYVELDKRRRDAPSALRVRISTTGRWRTTSRRSTRSLDRPECAWIGRDLEQAAQAYAVADIVPEHLTEVRSHGQARVDRQDRSGREGPPHQVGRDRWCSAACWSSRGVWSTRWPGGRRRRVPGGRRTPSPPRARARAIVMETERRLGFEPTDREFDKLGYDIESRDPATGKLRFIEVKGRRSDADTVTVTKNEILYSLNKPDDFILALVLFDSGGDDTPRVRYVRRPFQREPDFGAASVNYALKDLLASAEHPR